MSTIFTDGHQLKFRINMTITEAEVRVFYEDLTGSSGDDLLLEEIRRIIEKVDDQVFLPNETIDQIDDIIRDEIASR